MSLLNLLNPQPSGLAALRVRHGEIKTKKIETSAIRTAPAGIWYENDVVLTPMRRDNDIENFNPY